MIFTERTITVVNDSATINKPLILYRGDKNIELKITIAESQFKFRNNDASNVIETTDASYAQLVINTPYNSPIFSDVAVTKNGAVIFVITEAMIDEIREVGAYEIQIRLLDDNKQSRASIPPVSNAIEIREPIAIEDGSAVDSNVVNVAKVNRALTTTSAPLEAFDSQGNYIKKTWGDGDPITDAALNKMEVGIDGVNKKIGNNRSRIKDIENDIKERTSLINTVKMAAHMGLSAVEPQNTIPAFEKAGRMEFDAVECDINETKDGKFVIIHDSTVDRTTDGTGAIAELTLEQIKALNVTFGNNIDKYTNLKVPTLEEYLEVCKRYKMKPLMEVKAMDNNSIDNFLNILKAWGNESQVMVASFNYSLLQKIREKNKIITLVAFLTPTEESLQKCINLGKNTYIGCEVNSLSKAGADFVKNAHLNDILVNAYTIDDSKLYNQMINYGVDIITTNMLTGDFNLTSVLGDLTDLDVFTFPNNIVNAINSVSLPMLNTKKEVYSIDKPIKIGSLYRPTSSWKCIYNTKGTTNNRLGNNTPIYIGKNKIICVDIDITQFAYTFYAFDSSGKGIKDIGWINNKYAKLPNETMFGYIYIKKMDNSDFTDTDINTLKSVTIRTGKKNEVFDVDYIYNIEPNYVANTNFSKIFNVESQLYCTSLNPIHLNARYNCKIDIDASIDVGFILFNNSDNGIGKIECSQTRNIRLTSCEYIIPYFKRNDNSNIDEATLNLIQQAKITLYI